jgi:hypothetical protein
VADVLFEVRKRALEEEYFRKLNSALVAHMRATAREAREVQALEKASGVMDESLMDQLVHLGVTPETLPAFALVPLLEVAWADGKLDAYERRAVLADAGALALAPGSPAAEVLRGWLVERPAGGLFRLWFEFTREACRPLTPAARMELELTMLTRATAIARASGGLLGFGSPVSPQERADLNRVRAAYRP